MKKTKILILNLKKEYFNQIKSGEKTEEYREVKPYWTKRLENREYDIVEIRKGYPKKGDKSSIIRFPYKGFAKKEITHKLFGENPVEVYAIKLHESHKSHISHSSADKRACEISIKNLLESFLEHPPETKQEQTEMIKIAVEEITALFVGANPCGCPKSVSANPQLTASAPPVKVDESPCPSSRAFSLTEKQLIAEKALLQKRIETMSAIEEIATDFYHGSISTADFKHKMRGLQCG